MSPRSVCITYDLKAAMLLKDKELVSYFVKSDGTKPTPTEVRREIMLAVNKGCVVLPPCDNVDELGYCQGHEE